MEEGPTEETKTSDKDVDADKYKGKDKDVDEGKCKGKDNDVDADNYKGKDKDVDTDKDKGNDKDVDTHNYKDLDGNMLVECFYCSDECGWDAWKRMGRDPCLRCESVTYEKDMGPQYKRRRVTQNFRYFVDHALRRVSVPRQCLYKNKCALARCDVAPARPSGALPGQFVCCD